MLSTTCELGCLLGIGAAVGFWSPQFGVLVAAVLIGVYGVLIGVVERREAGRE